MMSVICNGKLTGLLMAKWSVRSMVLSGLFLEVWNDEI